jgi:hypothetical protein
MSIRSKLESDGNDGYERAVSRLRTGASRLMAERARKVERAANSQGNLQKPVEQRTGEGTPPQRTRRPAAKPSFDAWPLPGLAPMTRVRTSFGDVHAAALRKGDEVLTRSGAYMPILWLNRICLDARILDEKPDCNPVVFAAGALGKNLPTNEISVSPRQIVCAEPLGALERPEEAAKLVIRPGVRRMRETSLSYTIFHVGMPAEICCEGVFLLFPMDA